MPEFNGLQRRVVTIFAFLFLIPGGIFGNDGTGASIVIAVDGLYFLSIPFHEEKWNDRCSRYLVLFLFLDSLVLAVLAFVFQENYRLELTASSSAIGILACIINLAVPQKKNSSLNSESLIGNQD